MEPLAIMWNLSLTDDEGKEFNLVVQDHQVESMIATNFLTRRALNKEIVARTFKPLWRTDSQLDHRVVFSFEDDRLQRGF